VTDTSQTVDAPHEPIPDPPVAHAEQPRHEQPTTVDLTDKRRSVLRVPKLSPLAPVLGWVVAWGSIAIVSSVLDRLNVPFGFNLGMADGGPGDDGFPAGVWALAVSAGAFVVGGYTAARIARAHGPKHAVFVWVIAMLASMTDAIVEASGRGVDGFIRLLPGVPFWSDTGLGGNGEVVLIMTIFAVISLAGVLVGGVLGQTANRIDRTDDAIVLS
jgi:hypothetical protein